MSTPDEPFFLTRTMTRAFRPSDTAGKERPVSWVWEGYLARGYVTLLTGWWKIGKSTLLAALLARLERGGDLGGRAVSPGKAFVVTEEEASPWLYRQSKHRIGDATAFVYNPFLVKPVARQWPNLIQDARDFRAERGLDLLVIDTLAALLPGNEETNTRAMTDALRPVRDLAADGVAVLLVHHPRKGSSAAGQGARGTGALSGGVDTILEYQWAGSPAAENRRRLCVVAARGRRGR